MQAALVPTPHPAPAEWNGTEVHVPGSGASEARRPGSERKRAADTGTFVAEPGFLRVLGHGGWTHCPS